MSVTIDTSRLNRIIRNMTANGNKAVRVIAFAVEAKAKMRAPVDTGALRASIYVRMRGGGDMPSVPNPDAVRADIDEPREDMVAHVGPTVEYAAAVEFGGAHTGAQPYLIPAVREVEQELDRNPGLWRELINGE